MAFAWLHISALTVEFRYSCRSWPWSEDLCTRRITHSYSSPSVCGRVTASQDGSFQPGEPAPERPEESAVSAARTRQHAEGPARRDPPPAAALHRYPGRRARAPPVLPSACLTSAVKLRQKSPARGCSQGDQHLSRHICVIIKQRFI